VLVKNRWRRWSAAACSASWWPAASAPTGAAPQLDAACASAGVRVHYPELSLCTDNGAMIALAAAMRLQAACAAGADYAFDVKPRWPLESWRA
jgi:tRNA A37 threonylcarbamoyltransferase TsaD